MDKLMIGGIVAIALGIVLIVTALSLKMKKKAKPAIANNKGLNL